MRTISGRKKVAEMCADLLQDESNLSGAWCEAAAWPENTDEAREYMEECSRTGIKLTVSGGLTGIAGGALPEGGEVISASALKSKRLLGNGNDILCWIDCGIRSQ